nr:MAG TPA: hypothetical protein [Herelleviridae sp.]
MNSYILKFYFSHNLNTGGKNRTALSPKLNNRINILIECSNLKRLYF